MSAIILDASDYSVTTPEKTARLTAKEFGILSHLVQNAGHCVTAEELYRAVWHAEPFRCRMVIAVHICHIRKKIETDPEHPRFLKIVRGKGYIIEE